MLLPLMLLLLWRRRRLAVLGQRALVRRWSPGKGTRLGRHTAGTGGAHVHELMTQLLLLMLLLLLLIGPDIYIARHVIGCRLG